MGDGHAARALPGDDIPAVFDWRSVFDRELLDEVERRVREGGSGDGTSAEKRTDPGAGPGAVIALEDCHEPPGRKRTAARGRAVRQRPIGR